MPITVALEKINSPSGPMPSLFCNDCFFFEGSKRLRIDNRSISIKGKMIRAADPQRGMTLLELIVATSVLLILSSAAMPIFRNTVVRNREAELHSDLREIRNAIDKYKDFADKNLIRSEVGSQGYPPDLDTLVNGIDFGGTGTQRIRFLRRIPIDPMTGRADWNLQSVQDDPDTGTWGGHDVFDVHSSSQALAMDGSHYSTW